MHRQRIFGFGLAGFAGLPIFGFGFGLVGLAGLLFGDAPDFHPFAANRQEVLHTKRRLGLDALREPLKPWMRSESCCSNAVGFLCQPRNEGLQEGHQLSGGRR